MPNSPLRAGARKPNSLAGRAELAVTANARSQFAPQSVSTSADAANLITLGGETYRARMKNIEDVRRDDLVLAKNPETGELAAKRVERNFERVTDHLRILRIRNADGTEQTIETTNEHPFWVPGRGWVNAGDLAIGDTVTHTDGLTAELVASTYEPHPEGIPVYNFEVADLHNYFVSQSPRAPPVLVHNADYGDFVDLFRTVGVREFGDVMKNGVFRPAKNSLEARQFAFTMGEALKYADTDLRKVAIIRARVHRSVIGKLDFSNTIDPHIFNNGVLSVHPGEMSRLFHDNLISIAHVF
jgi:hypothetical protein